MLSVGSEGDLLFRPWNYSWIPFKFTANVCQVFIDLTWSPKHFFHQSYVNPQCWADISVFVLSFFVRKNRFSVNSFWTWWIKYACCWVWSSVPLLEKKAHLFLSLTVAFSRHFSITPTLTLSRSCPRGKSHSWPKSLHGISQYNFMCSCTGICDGKQIWSEIIYIWRICLDFY